MNTKETKKPVKLWVYLVYFVCLSILVGLGSWQFIRGLDKRAVELKVADLDRSNIRLQDITENLTVYEYRMVQVSGIPDMNRISLLANRTYQGKIGYEVFLPIVLSDSRIALINLGWLADSRADEIPELAAELSSDLEVQGQLYFPQKGFTLGEVIPLSGEWPLVIQALDMTGLTRVYGDALIPGVIVAESTMEFVKIWRPYVVNSARHYGYAMQWWGLAVVLLVFGFIWYRKSRSNE